MPLNPEKLKESLKDFQAGKKKTEKISMGEMSDVALEEIDRAIRFVKAGLAVPESGTDPSTGQETIIIRELTTDKIIFFTDLNWQIRYVKERLLL